MDSILTSVKKALGITEEYEHFDADIIMHINTVLSILHQLGVGPDSGFSISGKDETWSQLYGNDFRLDMIKSYVFMKVQLMFDPPLSSAVIEAKNLIIAELEWRILVAVETT